MSGKSTKIYEVCDILAGQLKRGEASGEMTKMTAIMLWSILIFREGMLSVKNIICVLVVFSGVLLVNQDAG